MIMLRQETIDEIILTLPSCSEIYDHHGLLSDWARKRNKYRDFDDAVKNGGKRADFEWLLEKDMSPTRSLELALSSPAYMRWLQAKNCICYLRPRCTVRNMADCTWSKNVLQVLYMCKIEVSSDWCHFALSACRQGRLDVIKWMYRSGQLRMEVTEYMDEAAAHGRQNILEWFDAHGAMCSTNAMNFAARNGQLETIKWLHDRDYNCTTFAINEAAKAGHRHVVEWLLANRDEGYNNGIDTMVDDFHILLLLDKYKGTHRRPIL